MTVQVDFIFDVTSPNVFLAHKVVPDIEEKTRVAFNYVPVLLGGIFKAANNQPPMMTMANVKGKFEYERLEFARFLKKHKINNFKMNSAFPVHSVLMQRCAIVAKQEGLLRPYLDAVLNATWIEDKNLKSAEALEKVLEDAKLDSAAIIASAQSDEIKNQLSENTSAAVERGCFGAPTFYVGEEMYFGKNTLRDVEEEILRQKEN